MLALYSHWLQGNFWLPLLCFTCMWELSFPLSVDLYSHVLQGYLIPSWSDFKWWVGCPWDSAICSQRLQKYLTPSCTDFIWCRRLGKSFVLYSQRLQEFIVSIPGRGWEDSEWTEWHEDNEGHAGQSKGGGAHTECGGPETEGTAGAPVG